MILEDRGDEVVLKPGMVVELQLYGDEEIARWDAEDALSDEERAERRRPSRTRFSTTAGART